MTQPISGMTRQYAVSTLRITTAFAALLFTTSARPDSGERASPPPGAYVLFDGGDLSHWARKKDGGPVDWKLENGYMEVVPGTGFVMTREKFGDVHLHVEFWLPLMANKTGEARANSGVYLQGRHEIQILDSYHNNSKPTGACAALYDTIAPFKNASLPPETWQTFDITYRAPRVDDDGKVMEPGDVTVVFNGETVIEHGRFSNVTDRFGGAFDENVGTPGPIMLQDHGAKIRFRNIWIVPMERNEPATASAVCEQCDPCCQPACGCRCVGRWCRRRR